MRSYRLSYPAHIYASVRAASVEEARRLLAERLGEVVEGILIDLDGVTGEVLYPDADANGEVNPEMAQLENLE